MYGLVVPEILVPLAGVTPEVVDQYILYEDALFTADQAMEA
jgi:hypothetical protein